MGGILEGAGIAIADLFADAGAAAGAGAAADAGAVAAADAIPTLTITAASGGAGLGAGALAGGALAGGLTAADLATAGASPAGGGGSTIPPSTINAPSQTATGTNTGIVGSNVAPNPAAAGPGTGTGGSIAGASSGISTPGVGASDLTSGINAAVPGSGESASGVPISGANAAFPSQALGETVPGVSGATAATSAAAPAATGASPGIGTQALTALGIGPQTAAGITGAVGSNLGTGVAAGGLLYNLLQPGPNKASTDALKSTASTLGTQATQLESYLNTGTLPAGAQSAVNQATNSAKAAIKSQYASMGLSGSTMETEALAQVDANASAEVFNIGSSLMTTGLNEAQISSGLYQDIININQGQSAQTGNAIAALAAALSGSQNKPGSYTLTPTAA